ncbi:MULTISPECIES: hypothetical protein [Moorena]|nr:MULTISPECIES: hypothetical protein [Moorena]
MYWSLGSRESGAVRPVANLIRLRKAHRGSRESGVVAKVSEFF